MIWWLWVIVGIGLLAVEMITPGGLFALFFGVGALLVAPLAALGLERGWQWILFPLFSLVLVVVLRGRLQARLRAPAGPPIDALAGEEVLLLEDLEAGGEAKAELRGAPWTVRAGPGIALARGQRARVERVDGVVLYVKAS